MSVLVRRLRDARRPGRRRDRPARLHGLRADPLAGELRLDGLHEARHRPRQDPLHPAGPAGPPGQRPQADPRADGMRTTLAASLVLAAGLPPSRDRPGQAANPRFLLPRRRPAGRDGRGDADGADPDFTDAYPLDWPTTVTELLRLSPRVVVPGHGDPVDATFVAAQRDDLATLADLCRAMLAGDQDTAGALRASPLPSNHPHRSHPAPPPQQVLLTFRAARSPACWGLGQSHSSS